MHSSSQPRLARQARDVNPGSGQAGQCQRCKEQEERVQPCAPHATGSVGGQSDTGKKMPKEARARTPISKISHVLTEGEELKRHPPLSPQLLSFYFFLPQILSLPFAFLPVRNLFAITGVVQRPAEHTPPDFAPFSGLMEFKPFNDQSGLLPFPFSFPFFRPLPFLDPLLLRLLECLDMVLTEYA